MANPPGPYEWRAAGALRHHCRVTRWEYARLEYSSTGTFGADRFMDWSASFYYFGGVSRWGTDERFDDLRHLNRAGNAGWQAYDRDPVYVGTPRRLHSVTYSLRRIGPEEPPAQ